MKQTKIISLFIIGLFILSAGIVIAQEEQALNSSDKIMHEKNMDVTMMNMCMETIASDANNRDQMLNKMMEKCSGDNEAMMQMCKTMMGNEEMHSSMMKMMGDMGMMKEKGLMKDDQTKDKEEKSTHEEHH